MLSAMAPIQAGVSGTASTTWMNKNIQSTRNRSGVERSTARAAEIADGWVRRDPVVCYIPPGGSEAIQVADGIERPNGIQLSPDEKTLYVNNSYGEYLLAFDVEESLK